MILSLYDKPPRFVAFVHNGTHNFQEDILIESDADMPMAYLLAMRKIEEMAFQAIQKLDDRA